jgi:hypothetical protein
MVAGLQKHVQLVPMYTSCEFESWQGVLDTLSDKVCQLFAVGLWFSIGYSVFSTSKTDRHDKTELLLKMAFNTTILTLTLSYDTL